MDVKHHQPAYRKGQRKRLSHQAICNPSARAGVYPRLHPAAFADSACADNPLLYSRSYTRYDAYVEYHTLYTLIYADFGILYLARSSFRLSYDAKAGRRNLRCTSYQPIGIPFGNMV